MVIKETIIDATSLMVQRNTTNTYEIIYSSIRRFGWCCRRIYTLSNMENK